jgi:hypothetical protein
MRARALDAKIPQEFPENGTACRHKRKKKPRLTGGAC